MIKKTSIAMSALMMALSTTTVASNGFFNNSDWSAPGKVQLVGGIYMNDHLREGTAGREHQIKMTRVIAGIDLAKGDLMSRIELVGLGDSVQYKADDPAYRDIYRNLGTDLYYYGDHLVREAWLGHGYSYGYWKAGRVISLLGEPGDSLRFASAAEAPHAVIMNTGIMNGVQAGISAYRGRVVLEGAVLHGRDRPCIGANCYIDGKLDPNEDGNNTPAFELKVSSYLYKDSKVYAMGHRNKVGSAIGSFESGKHNDQRLAVGFDISPVKTSGFEWRLNGQFNQFKTGLTEEGVQGEESGVESRDITQSGWFAVNDLVFPSYGVIARFTYEKLDRMDSNAWRDVAGFDETHPVNEAEESRQIITLIKKFKSGVSVRAFYRQDDVPYLTHGDKELEDRAGIVLGYQAKF